MQGRVDKNSNPIMGVKCVVNTCYYNINGSHCSAKEIEIQPNDASNNEETDCATFIRK